MGLAFVRFIDYHLPITEKLLKFLGSFERRDLVSWGLLIVLVGTAVYRSSVSSPIWIDVYLLYIPALTFCVPLLLIAVCTRKTWWSLVALVLGASLVFGLMIPFRSQNPTEPNEGMRLISLNIRSKSTDLTFAAASLMKLHPEFICLQELSRSSDLAEFRGLAPDYKIEGYANYDKIERNTFPEATFVAVRNDWEIRDFQWLDGVAIVEVARGSQRLVLVTLHGKRNKEYTPSALLDTAQQQIKQAEDLVEVLSRYEAPVLIAGDFNAPYTGPALKVLGSRYQSAFPAAGRGLELTFPALFPLARIDHVLGSEKIYFSNLYSKDFGSDHLGLVANFQVDSGSP